MGLGEIDPDAPTALDPTALGDTDAAMAWSEYVDEPPPRQRFSSRAVTAVAVAGSLVTMIGAAVLVGYKLNDPPSPAVAMPAPSPASPTLVPAGVPTPIAAPPSTVTVRAPAPPAPLPLPRAPRRSITGTYTTYLAWSGSQCLDARVPSGAGMPVETTCNGGSDTITHTAVSGQMVGVDPIMGNAVAISCRVIADATGVVLASDSGTVGDGHDINCIVDAP